MRTALIAAIGFVVYTQACVALGQAVTTLSWQHPVEYTDGAPLLLEDIGNTAVFYSDVYCDGDGLISQPNMVIVDAPADETVIEGLPEGEWCFAARTVLVDGRFSVPSNVATKVIGLDPREPQSLTTDFSATAYIVQIANDRISLVPIGTVDGPVSCNPMVAVADDNGRIAHRIPADSVTSFGGQEVIAAFAECGS